MSGANSTPLGRMNPVIGSGKKLGSSLLNPSYIANAAPASNGKHEPDMSHAKWFSPPSPSAKHELEESSQISQEEANERKKRRKSRWQGDEKEKTFIPGMPTVLPSNMSKDQEEAYLLQLQIEELSRRLRSNDLGIPPNPEDRSPSPEPIYNNEGKRLNTREYRTRKKLEEDRHMCIQKMLTLNTEYKPPTDYKPPVVKVSDKVMIPQEEHPDINFVGLLIGPRGNTLKSMEKDTGAKIIIRGKGSVKEGKVGRKDGGPMPGEDEPLHAYVTASNPESVKKAVDKIKEIIRQGVEVPEGQNDLRRMQLRELALLNGTLRENDGPRCSNCGSAAHKSWQCPDKPNVTNNLVCSSCGGAGHITKDCRSRRPGHVGGATPMVDRQKIDEEYMSLMAELGEGPPPPQNKNAGPQRPASSTTGIRSLFDTPVSPPRALLGPPPCSQPDAMNIRPNTSGGAMPPINSNSNTNRPNTQHVWTAANSNNNTNNNLGGGPPPSGVGGGMYGGPRPTRPPMGGVQNQQGGGGGGQSGFNRPPPLGWQSNSAPNNQQPPQSQGPNATTGNNSNNNFPSGMPPPNLLSAPPPPPPPNVGGNNTGGGGPPSWMNQAPPGPPGPHGPSSNQMNPWQGGPPPGMGCPPPGPVPPPRPVGPPPGWGWNGPQPVGPPPPPPSGNQGGPRGSGGVDLGALLSAPPPPPPS